MSTITGLAYRPGVPGDELCISVLAMQVFLDTYATKGISPDLAREALGVYSMDVFGARLRNPDVRMFIVEVDRHLVGFIDLSLNSPCPTRELEGLEVLRLYVQAPFQHRGIGQALLRISEDVAVEYGKDHIWLTAWVGNQRALAFYPAAGYKDAGTTQYAIEGQVFENRVFVKRLLGKAS